MLLFVDYIATKQIIGLRTKFASSEGLRSYMKVHALRFKERLMRW